MGNKCWFILLTVVKVMYKCFYFYFFPFCTLMINIMSPQCTSIMLIDELKSYATGKPIFSGVCDMGNHLVVDTILSSGTIWQGPSG